MKVSTSLFTTLGSAVLAAASLGSCTDECSEGKCDVKGELQLCAAIRGNGWNKLTGTQLVEISADSYNASMETESEFFTSKSYRPYENTSASLETPGCSWGVAK